jgi:hypothetical protein
MAAKFRIRGRDQEWVQLATRIPGRLRRDMKLLCIAGDRTVMDFVVHAIRAKLAREIGRLERRGR